MPDLQLGQPLDGTTVLTHRLQYGTNILPSPPSISFWSRYIASFNDPLIHLLCVALCVTFLLASFGYASWLEGIGIASSVFTATFVSTLSEHCNNTTFLKLQTQQDQNMTCLVSRQISAQTHLPSKCSRQQYITMNNNGSNNNNNNNNIDPIDFDHNNYGYDDCCDDKEHNISRCINPLTCEKNSLLENTSTTNNNDSQLQNKNNINKRNNNNNILSQDNPASCVISSCVDSCIDSQNTNIHNSAGVHQQLLIQQNNIQQSLSYVLTPITYIIEYIFPYKHKYQKLQSNNIEFQSLKYHRDDNDSGNSDDDDDIDTDDSNSSNDNKNNTYDSVTNNKTDTNNIFNVTSLSTTNANTTTATTSVTNNTLRTSLHGSSTTTENTNSELHNEEPSLVPLNTGDVVVGDIILIQCGDEICADGYLLTGFLTVNQASLTGEDIGINKEALPSDIFTKLQIANNSNNNNTNNINSVSDGRSKNNFMQQLNALKSLYPLDLETPQCVFKGSLVEEGTGTLLVVGVGVNTMSGKTVADLTSQNASTQSSNNNNNNNSHHYQQQKQHNLDYTTSNDTENNTDIIHDDEEQTSMGYKQAKIVLNPRDLRTSPLQDKLTKFAQTISFWAYLGSVIIACVYIFRAVVIRWKFDPQAIYLYIKMYPILFFKDIINATFISLIMIVVSVPEGLPTTITLVLSLNMRRLLQQKVLVRRLLGISTSGHITKLFVDKTGTLSTGQMSVEMCFNINSMTSDINSLSQQQGQQNALPSSPSSSSPLSPSQSQKCPILHIFPQHEKTIDQSGSLPTNSLYDENNELLCDWGPLQTLTYLCLLHSYGNANLRWKNNDDDNDELSIHNTVDNTDNSSDNHIIAMKDDIYSSSNELESYSSSSTPQAILKMEQCDLSSLVLDDTVQDSCVGGNSTDRALLQYLEEVKKLSKKCHMFQELEQFTRDSVVYDTIPFSSTEKFGLTTLHLSSYVVDKCLGYSSTESREYLNAYPNIDESLSLDVYNSNTLNKDNNNNNTTNTTQNINTITNTTIGSTNLDPFAMIATQHYNKNQHLQNQIALISPQKYAHNQVLLSSTSSDIQPLILEPSLSSSSTISSSTAAPVSSTSSHITNDFRRLTTEEYITYTQQSYTPSNDISNTTTTIGNCNQNIPKFSQSIKIVKGAVELILDCCTHVYTTIKDPITNKIQLSRTPLTSQMLTQTFSTINRVSSYGYRVIALATYPSDLTTSNTSSPSSIPQESQTSSQSHRHSMKASEIPKSLTLVAILALADQIRVSTPLAIALGEQAGISTAIISGDRAETCLQIARVSHIVNAPLASICNLETFLPRPTKEQIALGYGLLYQYNTIPIEKYKNYKDLYQYNKQLDIAPVPFQLSFLPVIIHSIATQYKYIALSSYHISQLSLLDIYLLLPRIIIVARATPEDKLKIILASQVGLTALQCPSLLENELQQHTHMQYNNNNNTQYQRLNNSSTSTSMSNMSNTSQLSNISNVSSISSTKNPNEYNIQKIKGFNVNGNQHYRFDVLPNQLIIIRFYKGKYLPYHQCNYNNIIKLFCHRLYSMLHLVTSLPSSLSTSSSSSLSLQSSTTSLSTSTSPEHHNPYHAHEFLPSPVCIEAPYECNDSEPVYLSTVNTTVCGFVGDGANDVSALTYVDVSFVLGHGAQTARNAGDILLLRDSLLCIMSSIWYGRSLFHNVRLFLLYQITINLSIVALMLLGPFFSLDFPLQLTQLLWLNVIMDCLAAIALSSELPELTLMKKTPLHPKCFIMNGKMLRSFWCNTIYICTISLYFLSSKWIHRFFNDTQFLTETAISTVNNMGNNIVKIIDNPIQQLQDNPTLTTSQLTPTPFLTGFFSFFIFMCTFHIFNVRTDRVNILHNISNNPLFYIIIPCILSLQISFTEIASLQPILQTVSLSIDKWMFVICFAATIIPFDICRKVCTVLYYHHYLHRSRLGNEQILPKKSPKNNTKSLISSTSSSPSSSPLSPTSALISPSSLAKSTSIMSTVASMSEHDADEYLSKMHHDRISFLNQLFNYANVNTIWIDSWEDEIIEKSTPETQQADLQRLEALLDQ